MGLFSRKQTKSSRQATQRPRPSVSSEAQAATLRVRARRRLAGAVALVLAAVIVLPMLLDGEPRPVPAGIEIVVPQRNAPFNPDLSPPPASQAQTLASAPGSASQTAEGGETSSVAPTTEPDADTTGQQGQIEGGSEQAPASSAALTPSSESEPESKPEPKPEPQAAPDPAPAAQAPKPAVERDNTATAMAILEGRQPSGGSQSTSGSSSGSYVLQIASYGSQADAQARVETLKSQGVSNAFVEPATVNDKPTFRLRVGPFDSNSAAQAAQARLRTLGYDNGFITTK